MTLALQILIDGFAISALYGLGAVGFTLMFGVSGVLNLAHGGTMLVAAVVAWGVADQAGAYGGALAGLRGRHRLRLRHLLRHRPADPAHPAIPGEEKEIFVLTGTLLWGIMIQEAVAYLTTTSPHTVRPLIAGVVDLAGVRTPTNEILTAALCWAAIGLLWAADQPHPDRQGAAGGLDQPARPDAAGLRAVEHPPAGLGHLRRAGRDRRACCSARSSASAPTMPAR